MRKTGIFICCLCLFFTLVLSVSADVIWEPYNDSFYDDHREEMQYENRTYRATADLPYLNKPDGKELGDAKIAAGENFNVQYLYEDENGIIWGNVFDYSNDIESAWVRLNGCVRAYDRQDFANDYSSAFEDIASQPDASFYTNDVILYEYPGAELNYGALYVQENAENLPEYAHSYTDAAGNVWGELLYHMGQKGWVLLSGDIQTATAPDKAMDTVIGISSDVPAADAQTEPNVPVSQQTSDVQNITPSDSIMPGQTEKSGVILPVLLVVAVVAVSLVLLFVFFRKKKK